MGTEINFGKLYQLSSLTFRYYYRLSYKQKLILKRAELSPALEVLALKIFKITDYNLKQSIKIALRIYPEYGEYLSKIVNFKSRTISIKQVIREFEYQGFISIPYNFNGSLEDNIIIGISTMGLNNNMAYICSNKALEGNLYILPKEFSWDYKSMQINSHSIIDNYHHYGVYGHTKLWINKKLL